MILIQCYYLVSQNGVDRVTIHAIVLTQSKSKTQ